MKRLVFLVALVLLVIILAKLPASPMFSTCTSLADSNMPDNELKEK